jgi:hypothetical protein
MLSGFVVDDEARTAFHKAIRDTGVLTATNELARTFVADDPQLGVQLQMQLDMLNTAIATEAYVHLRACACACVCVLTRAAQ